MQVSGPAVGESCPSCISETARYREVYSPWGHWLGCRHAASWSHFDLTFDLAVVTLTYKTFFWAISRKK